MNKNLSVLLMFPMALAVMFFSGCVTNTTKAAEFPLMYEEAPTTILVLPPINESTAADAKQYYATTIHEPFTYAGYYVFPQVITSEILKMEGIYDTELLVNLPLAKFNEFFGADAVLFTTIKKWNMSYLVISSTLTVEVNMELKSTKTDQILWQYDGKVVADLSGDSGGGLLGAIIATAINSAVADYVVYARKVNYMVLSTAPVGPYHTRHLQDQNDIFVDQTKNK